MDMDLTNTQKGNNNDKKTTQNISRNKKTIPQIAHQRGNILLNPNPKKLVSDILFTKRKPKSTAVTKE